MATHTLADNTRKTTLTISGSETIIFPTKLNWFGVRSLDGADILASKIKEPTTLEDGVYSTDEGDGDIIIDDGVFTDTLYLNGSGKVAVFGGVKDSRNPFNIGGKGGGSGSSANIYRTTTALTDGATTNPITVDGESVTAVSGDFAVYNTQEFLFDGTQWNLLGDRVGLGDLAYKDTASGTAVTTVGTLPSLIYDSANERLIFDAGSLPTSGTVTVS